MNNTQLDMVLSYLNEGAEIDNNEFLIESINDFYEQSIYESNQFVNLLEVNATFEKVKESVKKFINWIRSLITKLKLKIKQMSVNILSKVLDKNIAKQKEAAKDADLDAKITLAPMEYLMLFHGTEMITIDDDKLEELYMKTSKSNKELTETGDMDGMIYKTLKKFGKLPMPMLVLVTKLTDLATNAAIKSAGTEEKDKEERTITIQEYLDKLDDIKEAGENAKQVLEDALKSYDEMIQLANKFYNTNAQFGNKMLSTATGATRFIIDVSSGALKCITYATAVSAKHIKKSKKKTEEKSE